jgi:serine/threonine-protein kinase
LSTSSDDEVKTDAYIMLADWDIEDNDLSAARNTLLKARKDILNSNLRMILEKLAQVDIDLANSGNQNSYRKEAISIFEEIINKGWGTYQTYNNLVVLYQKMGDTTAAIRLLNTMEKEYGKDYNTYKRHAILEYDIQAKKTASTRDYSYFETYYRQAVKAYDTSLNDAEMDVLDEMYRNVKEGGWL